MLGETKRPGGVEAGGSLKGMGLLPMDTVFAGEKARTPVQGEFLPCTGAFAPLSGCAFEGMRNSYGRNDFKKKRRSLP